jgi:hypothetical protein
VHHPGVPPSSYLVRSRLTKAIFQWRFKATFKTIVSFFIGFLIFLSAVVQADSVPIPTSRKDVAALQLALDNAGFSPGIIDGNYGNRTTRALKTAQDAGKTIEPVHDAWQTWKIPEDFLSDLAPVPSDWVAKSQLAVLGYETASEKIAETFHTSEEFLRFLNPKISKWNSLKDGDTLKVPILNTQKFSS